MGTELERGNGVEEGEGVVEEIRREEEGDSVYRLGVLTT